MKWRARPDPESADALGLRGGAAGAGAGEGAAAAAGAAGGGLAASGAAARTKGQSDSRGQNHSLPRGDRCHSGRWSVASESAENRADGIRGVSGCTLHARRDADGNACDGRRLPIDRHRRELGGPAVQGLRQRDTLHCSPGRSHGGAVIDQLGDGTTILFTRRIG